MTSAQFIPIYKDQVNYSYGKLTQLQFRKGPTQTSPNLRV